MTARGGFHDHKLILSTLFFPRFRVAVEEGGHIHTNIVSDGALPEKERKKVEVARNKKSMKPEKKRMSTDKERSLANFASRQECMCHFTTVL